ncbi:MAG: tyrosine-type recombinase/integrase, partial [Gordonia sp. (in: high G+C Gram-positive bacteria)]
PLATGGESFRVRWREAGRQRIQTFTDLASAEKFRRNIEKFGPAKAYEIVDALDTVSDTAHGITLAEFAGHHIDHLTGVTSGTIHKYRRYLGNDLAEIGELDITHVTETVVAGWVQWLTDEVGNSGKTVANKHGFLASVLARAVRDGLIDTNPCDRTRLPRTDAQREPRFLTSEEFAAIRDGLPPRYRPLVTWLVGTGMRFSEATALRVGDLDIRGEVATARISRAWKYTGSSRAELGPPKSRAGRRTVDVPAEVVAVVDLAGREADDLLFATPRGGRVKYATFHPYWAAAAASAGVQASPHDLRHTCASWMIADGTPLPVIQAHMGHESVTVTVGVYGHLDRSSYRRAAASVGKMLTDL